VQISSLRIDRFGVWNDFNLRGISEGLNVIYGPLDSDQTAIIQFLRTMLFGFGDETHQRYTSANSRGAGGSITVQGQFGCQTVYRHDDGEGRDRLVVENDNGLAVGNHHLQHLLAGAAPSVFDRVFMPGIGSPSDITKLIDVAVGHGFDVIGESVDVKRVDELRKKLADKCRLFANASGSDKRLEELLDARRSLTQRIKTLENLATQQRESFDEFTRKLASEIQDLESQLDELTQELGKVDSEIAARETEKREKEQAIQEAKRQLEQLLAERRKRLNEMDAKLKRWGGVLEEIETFGQKLNAELKDDERAEDAVDCDPRYHLRRLEENINGLDQASTSQDDAIREHDRHYRALQSTIAPALGTMREDVYHLCTELNDRETELRQSELRSEVSQLKRAEAELRRAIQGLASRRRRLVAEFSETHDVRQILVDPAHANLCRCAGHPKDVNAAPALRDVPALEEEVVAGLDAEIGRLRGHRDEIVADIDAIQDVLRQSRQRLEQLRLDYERDSSNDLLSAKRNELERVKQQIRGTERRGELTAAIAAIEREIRLLETATRQPSILREASDLLRRLTAGELDEITITKERAVWICNRRGNEVVYHQFGSRARDQVYLSICLAIVAAHARKGVRLPIVLRDRLLHVDSEDFETTASLLNDFAGRGHQVFLFTQHRYVADLFRSLDVRVRELPRPVKKEAAPVEVDKETDLTEAERSEVNRQLSAIAEETAGPKGFADQTAFNSEEFPGELTDRVRVDQTDETEQASKAEDDRSKSRFFLYETSPIREAPSIDSAIAECLQKIGVLKVRDLLNLDVEEAADRLRHAGITTVMIRRWQAESLLTCRVPGLRRYDARILVACGITDPDQLVRTDVDELRRRVELFGATDTGQRLFKSGSPNELRRVTDWVGVTIDDGDNETVVERKLRAA